MCRIPPPPWRHFPSVHVPPCLGLPRTFSSPGLDETRSAAEEVQGNAFPKITGAAASKDASATGASPGRPPQAWTWRTAGRPGDSPRSRCSKPGPTRAEAAAWAGPPLPNATEPSALSASKPPRPPLFPRQQTKPAPAVTWMASLCKDTSASLPYKAASPPKWAVRLPSAQVNIILGLSALESLHRSGKPSSLRRRGGRCSTLETGQTVTAKEHSLT